MKVDIDSLDLELDGVPQKGEKKFSSLYPVDTYEGSSQTYKVKFDNSKLCIPYQVCVICEEYNAILAGGSLRPLFDKKDKVMDYDLFFTSQDDLDSALVYLEQEGFHCIFRCPGGLLFTYLVPDEEGGALKIQIIRRRLYSGMEDLINSFDITACMAATDCIGTVVFNRMFPRDVRSKTVRLNVVTYPTATLNRIRKYERKGYLVNGRTYAQFMGLINGREFAEVYTALYID